MSDRKPIAPHGGTLPAGAKNKALSESAFEARLQAMRREAGIEEERVLRFCCGATANEFMVHMSRPEEGGRFAIIKMIRGEPVVKERTPFFGKAVKSSRKAQTFDINEFDFEELKCPWCGDEEGFVHCHRCTYFVCCARVRQGVNRPQFRCHDECGASFSLAPMTSIETESGGGLLRRRGPKVNAISIRSGAALPRKSMPRLGGGK